jgi:AcrR family transcriptional regulator
MVQAPDDEWTVKRIAAALGVGPTKLYHHIGILEDRELIRPAGTRVVSGIIETRYRIAQLSVRLDRSLLSGGALDEAAAAVDDVVRSVFDTAREDVGRALRSGEMTFESDGGASRGILRQDLTRLSPARVAELQTRLAALLAEFEADEPDDAADGRPFGLLVALYPVTDTRQEPNDD